MSSAPCSWAGYGVGRGLPGQPAAQHLRLRQPPGLPRQHVRRLLCGLVYWKTRDLPATLAGEVFGTGIIGACFVLSCGGGLYGRSGRLHRLYAYVVPFLVSTVGGSILPASWYSPSRRAAPSNPCRPH